MSFWRVAMCHIRNLILTLLVIGKTKHTYLKISLSRKNNFINSFMQSNWTWRLKHRFSIEIFFKESEKSTSNVNCIYIAIASSQSSSIDEPLNLFHNELLSIGFGWWMFAIERERERLFVWIQHKPNRTEPNRSVLCLLHMCAIKKFRVQMNVYQTLNLFVKD